MPLFVRFHAALLSWRRCLGGGGNLRCAALTGPVMKTKF
jgi:hypothetical protein